MGTIARDAGDHQKAADGKETAKGSLMAVPIAENAWNSKRFLARRRHTGASQSRRPARYR